MFFTFWGLKAIQKGNLTGKRFLGRMVGVMNRGGIDRIGPSHFNFGGIGRWMFKKMMKDENVVSLPELRQQCIDLGVKFLACNTSMDVMQITQDDLIPGVEVAGAATVMLEAQQAQSQWFI
jgi:peroxiredoxin family protein